MSLYENRISVEQSGLHGFSFLLFLVSGSLGLLGAYWLIDEFDYNFAGGLVCISLSALGLVISAILWGCAAIISEIRKLQAIQEGWSEPSSKQA